jgi:hypothetical protein
VRKDCGSREAFALKDAQRGALRDRLARLIADRSPISALRKRDALSWTRISCIRI